MEITILYDNQTESPELKADWGFAAYITVNGINILFDTGGNGEILLYNMKKLKKSAQKVDIVFLSHHHFDHIGGLAHFLNENSKVKVYAPPLLRGIKNAKKVVYVEKQLKIASNIFSTGELKHIEQSLCIKTKDSFVVIVGCSHPGIDTILTAAEKIAVPTHLIGGFHGFNQFNLLKPLKKVCPAHCTQYKKEIVNLYPEKCINGGVGAKILI